MDMPLALATIAADAERGEMIFPTNVDIALRVRRMLDDPDCAIEPLSKLISTEPVLSARVVAVANSIAYNPYGRTSSDLRSAVSRIGMNTLRSLATAVVVRQMQAMPKTPALQALAQRLWLHTTEVATLARVIAKKVTHQDPEAAFFAGVVHEVGSFYLLSRAADFPELLQEPFAAWREGGEAQVGRAVLKALAVPEPVLAALEVMWDGFLAMPPASLGDTLLLADELASQESPLAELAGLGRQGALGDLNLLIGEEMLQSILADSAEEMASLSAALQA